MNWFLIDQLGILAFGLTAVLCTQLKSPRANKWAPLIGMLGQPFWIHSAWLSEQWGILAINVAYTYVWGLGIWNRWIEPRLSQ